MKICVRFFARARDLAGSETCVLDLPQPVCVADVRQAVLLAYPQLQPLAAQLLVAVNSEYAPDHTALSPESEVAMFPPVSGG